MPSHSLNESIKTQMKHLWVDSNDGFDSRLAKNGKRHTYLCIYCTNLQNPMTS